MSGSLSRIGRVVGFEAKKCSKAVEMNLSFAVPHDQNRC